MNEVPWLGGPVPATRREVHFDRVVSCFAERPGSLYALLAEAAARESDREALVCGEERLTWRELEAVVGRAAAGFAARGIGPGDRVAFLLGNRSAFVTALFGLARLGAVAVPIGIRNQAPEVAHILADCGARLILHEADLPDRVPDPAAVPSLEAAIPVPSREAGDLLEGSAQPPPVAPVAEEDICAILYTSGTTGRPKGAMLTHLGMVSSAMAYELCMGLTAQDRSVASVPLSHVTGLVANVAAMARCAGTLIVMPIFKAPDFLALAARERMTHTVIVPAMYDLCLLQPDFASHDLSSWRIGGYGGAPMPTPTIARLAEVLPKLLLMNAYGATETTSPTTLMPPAFTATRPDSVGVPVPNVTVLVMDEAGREVPPGEVGEIWISGPAVVKGYWGNEAATREGFAGGFWRSGDLGSIDADGFVRVLDRKKDMVNRGGYKIFTAEVETVLAGHPAVLESAVVGAPSPVLGERVHAFVVARGPLDPEELRAYCAARLADYKVPETFTVRDAPLPRNANGKVMKRELRADPALRLA